MPEEKMVPRSVRFGINVLWNAIGQAGLMVISFFLVPYLVQELGIEGYALYGLLGVLTSYLALLTFGSGNASLKFISEYLGSKDFQGIQDILKVSLLMHTLPVALGAFAVFFWKSYLASHFFRISPTMQVDGSWILGCSALSAIFFTLTQLAVSIFQGMQMFGTANGIAMIQTGGILGGSALLLYWGFGLHEVGLFYLGAHILLSAAFLRKALARMPATPTGKVLEFPSLAKTKSFLSYSFQVFLTQLGWSVTFQWDKVFIAYFFPLAQLTYYLIPSFILQRFWIIPSSVSASVFPLISELAGRGETAALKKVYRQCGQLVLWLVLPGFVVLFTLAPQFLTLWMGPVFSEKGVWPLRLLLGGYFFYLLAIIPNVAAFGTGNPQWVVLWQSLQAALCCFFWYLWIPRFNIIGAALGFFLSQALTSMPYAWLISRFLFQMSFLEYWSKILWRPLASGGILLILLWPLRTYAWGWTTLIGLAASSLVVYYSLGYCFLDSEAKETSKRLWNSLW